MMLFVWCSHWWDHTGNQNLVSYSWNQRSSHSGWAGRSIAWISFEGLPFMSGESRPRNDD